MWASELDLVRFVVLLAWPSYLNSLPRHFPLAPVSSAMPLGFCRGMLRVELRETALITVDRREQSEAELGERLAKIVQYFSETEAHLFRKCSLD